MVEVVAMVLLVPATAACGYWAGLLLVGLRRRPARTGTSVRFAVLIPAHDEVPAVVETIRSVRAADYPQELVSILVVADNCTDGTAAVARLAGADAVERHDTTRVGKGYALAFGLPTLLDATPDAVLMLDADCELRPNALRAFAAALADHDAVQAAVETGVTADPGSLVAAAGSVLDNAAAAGKFRLGFPVPLRGTGMAFRADLLRRVPWADFGLTEDAEYSARLTAAGVRVAFEPAAVVVTVAPPDPAEMARQRRRWRAALFVGRFGVAYEWVNSKPLVLAELAAAAAAAALAGGMLVWWAAVLVAVTGCVYMWAVAKVGLTRGRVKMLAAAPGVVVRMLAVTAGGFVRREAVWQRTRRAGEVARG